MPKLDSGQVKVRMAELDISLERLADEVGMTKGTLRNAVSGYDPIRLGRAYTIARALGVAVSQILAGENEGVPDEPPQPTTPDPKGPKRRQDTEGDRTGPRRPKQRSAA